MTRKLTLLLIILSSIITFGQEKKKQIEITYGAEKEIIPKVGDTIKEYYSNKKIREIVLKKSISA